MEVMGTFAHKLGSAILLLLLLCVVFLLAWELSRVKFRGMAARGPRQTVTPRSESIEPAASNRSVVAVEQLRPATPQPTENPKAAATPPAIIDAPRAPVRPQAEKRPVPNRGTVRLADGREVTFGGLTYGLEHSYAHQEAPAEVTKTRRDSGMNTISIKTASASLVVWLHCKAAKGSFLEADFISVVDEAGKQSELSNPTSIFNPAEFETVGAWQVSNFPRRDAKIGVRFYSRDSSYKFHLLAEFWAPNPAPRTYDVWRASAVPISKTFGNNEYRFLSLMEDQAPPRGAQTSTLPPGGWSTATFTAGTRGQPGTRWKVGSIALSDATGNVSIPDNTHFSSVGDYLLFSFNRSFWGSETAGKLRAEFVRENGFAPNELVTFRNIQVPSGKSSVAIQTQKRAGDVALRVEQLQRHTPAVRMADGRWNLELTTALVPATAAMHVSLAEVRDQTGQELSPGVTHKLANGRQSFLFHTGPQSLTLNITFAVQKSRFVQFVVPLRNGTDQFTRAGLLQEK
jgi:hypothetical protein